MNKSLLRQSAALPAATLTAVLALGGCASVSRDPSLPIRAPTAWSNAQTPVAETAARDEQWWTRLQDPAIDTLIEAALRDNPTLLEALARVDQARASLRAGRASQLPRVDVSGAAAYGEQDPPAAGAGAGETTTASIGPTLSWEIDLWGRVGLTARAAQNRLDARTADARDARLSVAAELAAGVLRLRACHYSLMVRTEDIRARTLELELMRTRLEFGNVAPVDVADARSNLAIAETDRISQRDACTREINALVAISGLDNVAVRALFPDLSSLSAGDNAAPGAIAEIIPAAPPMRPVVPAIVLLHHPRVMAAEREAAARWAEIGVARAERMPRIDLAAMLTGQWIRASGVTTESTTWSAGPQLVFALFDGGAGAANVSNAEARYRESVASLEGAVRAAVQDIEDALSGQASANERMVSSQEALAAARIALTANQARLRAGAISRFEFEESRRQYNRAQESAIAAARDHALAWVELIRVSGNAFDLAGTPDPETETAPDAEEGRQ